jgi:anti-anti-sigma factor
MSHDTSTTTTLRETVHEYLTVRQNRERVDLEQVRPIGEIDLCTAPVLRDALADAERRQVPNVLVDLSQVDFLALIGVQVLRAACERSTAADRRLVVAAPTPAVQRVLSLTDIADDLEIYVTVPSALSALTH